LSAEQDPQKRADKDCPFCAIAQGWEPSARIVASAPAWVAFFPPQPATPGHTLVIPRRHVPDFWAADETTTAEVSRAAVDVGRGIQRALSPDGLNLITSAGDAAEQTVLHLHVHVVPRWVDDAFGKIWPPKGLVAQVDVDAAFERVRREMRA
jgi:histidine triad (HIT) family protein